MDDVTSSEDNKQLLMAYRAITPAPKGHNGFLSDLTDLLTVIKDVLNAFGALFEMQKKILRANKEVAHDILHKMRYVERVAIAFGTMTERFNSLPDTDEPSRALLLRAVDYLEVFSNAESNHTDVKNLEVWNKHKAALVSKKFYTFLSVFYDEFSVLATALTRQNERLAQEVKVAKSLLNDAWYDGSPAANRSIRHLLEAARAADAMGGAIVDFMETLKQFA